MRIIDSGEGTPLVRVALDLAFRTSYGNVNAAEYIELKGKIESALNSQICNRPSFISHVSM